MVSTPLPTVRYLETIGTVVALVTHFNDLPSAAEMDAESCYLRLDIVFDSTADKVVVEDTFQFMREDCKVNVLLANDVDH